MTGAMAMTNGEKKAHAVYCVRKGDTLDVVARRYGVGVSEILSANPGITSPDLIQEGSKMVVPLKQVLVKQNRIMKAVKVQQGNTLHGLAAVYGTSVQNLMVCNGLSSDTIYPGEDLLIPLTLCRGNVHFGAGKVAAGAPTTDAGGSEGGLASTTMTAAVAAAATAIAGGQHVASMRDLCRSYLCRRTHRRRLPSPTVLGASFIGGEELSDFTVMALKALQGKQRIHVSGHTMRQMRRKDKLREIGLQKLTDDFKRAASLGLDNGAKSHGHGGPFRFGLKSLGQIFRRRQRGLGDTFVPPCEGVLTSPFGPRWGKVHRGIDIAAETGTPIKSVGAGVVTFSGWDGPGYGHLVEIDHGDGMATRYAHCSEIFRKRGDSVGLGEVIGSVGETGRATGPHLHFEVRREDEAIDPLPFMRELRDHSTIQESQQPLAL